jgi:hypothetical protein
MYMPRYFAPFPLFCLHCRTLPSRQKSWLIIVTLPVSRNLLPKVVQGLVVHPLLPHCILRGILPTCITFPLLEGFPISFLGPPSGIYIAS